MKKIDLGILIGAVVLMISGIGGAQALVFMSAKVVPSGVTVTVPDVALKAPALEPGSLERTIFIHYSNGKVVLSAKTPTCYKLLGVKWKSLPVSYVVDPALEDLVLGAVAVSNETWDAAATSKELFNDIYTVASANWDSDYPDGKNEYSFGDYPDPEKRVIAVTVVWSGVPIGGKGRQIIEYDVMFDTDFTWGNADSNNDGTVDNPNVMDLQNIAIHESGHGVGLADISSTSCSEVTMYGYSSYGEIKKRTLETPDIIGLQKLYGL